LRSDFDANSALASAVQLLANIAQQITDSSINIEVYGNISTKGDAVVMSIGTILLIILVIALLGGFSGLGGGLFYGTGYYGGGGLGLVLVVVLILVLLRKL
jgi:Protein of unknown function (DUF3309)